MGKLSNSLLSGSNGRTGRVVVANVFGTEILRARPRRRTAAPSPKQLLVQSRMSKSYDFILPYKAYAKEWFGRRSGLRSPYNQAIASVLSAFKLNYAQNKITLAYSEIEFSRGDLLAPVPENLTPEPGKFTLTWFNNSGSDLVRETDDLQVLYYAEGQPKPVFLENIARRQDSSVEIAVPPALAGKTVHVWMAFRAADLSDVSLSSYAGSVQLT